MNSIPKNIYKDFKNKKINIHTAFDLLTSLFENDDNELVRESAIKTLENLGLFNDRFFFILEHALISDSNVKIRTLATTILRKKFIDKAFNPLMWALKHETDLKCLIIIIESLAHINTHDSKLILLNEIKKIMKIKWINKDRRIENNKYKKIIKKLYKSKELSLFTQKKLAEILINFLIVKNLCNSFPNVFFEIDPNNGLVMELDLSDYLQYEVKGTPFGWKNDINSLSEIVGLKYLKNLKRIDLSNNQIKDVMDLIYLKNLQHVVLINNKISEEKNLEYLKKLPKLEFLDLRDNMIAKKTQLNEFNPKIRVILKDYIILK